MQDPRDSLGWPQSTREDRAEEAGPGSARPARVPEVSSRRSLEAGAWRSDPARAGLCGPPILRAVGARQPTPHLQVLRLGEAEDEIIVRGLRGLSETYERQARRHDYR